VKWSYIGETVLTGAIGLIRETVLTCLYRENILKSFKKPLNLKNSQKLSFLT
jgi:hypothetical protein